MKINNNGTFVDVKKIFINDNGTFKEVKKILNSSSVVLYKGATSAVATYNWSYVDLGLPSGTLWADRNIGATSITDYGLFYQFGDVDGYERLGKNFSNWSDYKYMSNGKITKYCSNSEQGIVDNKKILDYSDDAAYKVSGGLAKIPNKTQFQELLDYCTWEYTTINGINGYKVSRNGKYIFLPLAGSGSTNNFTTKDGRYHVSSLENVYSDYYQFILSIYNPSYEDYEPRIHDSVLRHYGSSIRPVKI